MKRLSTVIGVVLGCLFLLLSLAVTCFLAFGKISVTSTSRLRSGRTVTAQNDGWGGLSAQDSFDTTTLEMAGHLIVVAPKQVIVDGHTFATIDEKTKSIAINAHKDEITFEADGKPVGSLLR